MDDSKSAFTSKTLWFNVLYTLAALIGLAQDWPFLPEHADQYLIAGQGVINLVLRQLTSQGLHWS